MSTDEEELRQQKELILDHLSCLGLAEDYDVEIPDPDPESPLAELVIATRFVRDNLALVARQRDESARELEAKIATIELQARSILDLSTPVIQVWDGILVLPLIGSIDTARAEQILQNLLRTVAARGAAVVILDITGVPMIDTAVANHLLETVKAVRLLGAEAILAGVSPSIAQTLVRLGIDLAGLDSRAHLQSALALAFTMTGKRVAALDRDVHAPGRDRP